MNMSLQDCIQFANDNPLCYIATCEGNKPRVRAFMMWFADESGFYFHSGSMKACCEQLRKNPNTEVCFYLPAPMPDPGKMLRVAGEVEFLNDIALRTRLLEERPFLKDMGMTGPEDERLAVFRIASGEAYFWTMANNLHEAEAEKVKF
jgi:pyridoxamine 5'-phosphate oxidase